MDRTEIIQRLIDKYNFKSYLEIGVQGGLNFNKIKCDVKIGVDPDPDSRATLFMTSDDYFKALFEFPEGVRRKYDVIFIDGLHEDDQVEKDIANSLKCLNQGGFIVCHDMNPPTELHQRVPRESKQWNGDCWKAFVKLRDQRIDLIQFVIDCDWGVGIIKSGHQVPLGRTEELTYDNFDRNRQRWLNLVNPEWFERMYL